MVGLADVLSLYPRFYTLVTRETKDQDFAMHRQLFLAEQGYAYEIRDEQEVLAGSS